MKKLVFPETWAVDNWYGFKRHHFEFQGHPAWIVEPDFPAGDGRWSWCMMWAEAFVKRVGTVDLLEHGFYHVFIDLFETRANPEGVKTMCAFQKMLTDMGLAPKVNLIGLSWGGFFSLRYAETYPENVAAIYLDAPLCNICDPDPSNADRQQLICTAYGQSAEQLAESKLNPVNNVKAIVDAGIPVLAAVGECDGTVIVKNNFNIVEQEILKYGGKVEVFRRGFWAHHPHGLDDTLPLLKFHCSVHES